MAVQIPMVDELPQAMAVRYPNANKNKIIGVPEHLMCGQYFMIPVPAKYLDPECVSIFVFRFSTVMLLVLVGGRGGDCVCCKLPPHDCTAISASCAQV